jgi:hypothetical protein
MFFNETNKKKPITHLPFVSRRPFQSPGSIPIRKDNVSKRSSTKLIKKNPDSN